MSDGNHIFKGSAALGQTPIPQTPAIRIMLVDDDSDCRMLIKDAITGSRVPVEIVEAANGMEAIKILDQLLELGDSALPGLIFLDIEMPVLNGLATLERIKSNPQLRGIPVVIMTGVSDDFHMQKAAQLGANSYTLKPANAEQFLQTVHASANYWLEIHQSPTTKMPQSQCRR